MVGAIVQKRHVAGGFQMMGPRGDVVGSWLCDVGARLLMTPNPRERRSFRTNDTLILEMTTIAYKRTL